MVLKFARLLGLLSAGTCWYFGNASDGAYYRPELSIAGEISGVVFGVFAGICFAMILPMILTRLSDLKSTLIFSCAAGMVTGVICSSLVHVSLMIAYNTNNYHGIIIGIPFGILAGSILGLISVFLFIRLSALTS